MKRAAVFIFLLFCILSFGSLEKVQAQATPAPTPWVIRTGPSWQDAMGGNDNNVTKTSYGWARGYVSYLGSETNNLPSVPGSSQTGAVNFISNVVAMTFTSPPAELGTWIADTGQTLGFIPHQAYAQE